MTKDLFKPMHTKKKITWKEAEPVYNELSRLIGGGLNGVDNAIGLSSGNFNRYKSTNEITVVSYNAMKGVLSDIKKPKPAEVCLFSKQDLTKLLVMVAQNGGDSDLIITIAAAMKRVE